MDPGSDPSPAGDPQGDPPPAVRRPFAFPRARRLTRGADLDRVRRRGRRVRAAHLEVRVLPTASPSRVGIIVPRHRHSAVDRNRLKRRLRELVRTRLLPMLTTDRDPAAGREVVVRARAEAYDDTFEALAGQIEHIVAQLRAHAAARPTEPVPTVNPGDESVA